MTYFLKSILGLNKKKYRYASQKETQYKTTRFLVDETQTNLKKIGRYSMMRLNLFLVISSSFSMELVCVDALTNKNWSKSVHRFFLNCLTLKSICMLCKFVCVL